MAADRGGRASGQHLGPGRSGDQLPVCPVDIPRFRDAGPVAAFQLLDQQTGTEALPGDSQARHDRAQSYHQHIRPPGNGRIGAQTGLAAATPAGHRATKTTISAPHITRAENPPGQLARGYRPAGGTGHRALVTAATGGGQYCPAKRYRAAAPYRKPGRLQPVTQPGTGFRADRTGKTMGRNTGQLPHHTFAAEATFDHEHPGAPLGCRQAQTQDKPG